MPETNLGEQPPTLLRRHAAGTDSARGVLFTGPRQRNDGWR